MDQSGQLSAKAAAILKLIAEGHSYAQIVDGHPAISYLDIFAAAEEALRLSESPTDYQRRLADIRERYPRAYEPWSPDDERRLAELFNTGQSAHDIARVLQRQPSAIRSRLVKLGLIPDSDRTFDRSSAARSPTSMTDK